MTTVDRLACARRHFHAHVWYLSLLVAAHGWPPMAIEQMVAAMPVGGTGVEA